MIWYFWYFLKHGIEHSWTPCIGKRYSIVSKPWNKVMWTRSSIFSLFFLFGKVAPGSQDFAWTRSSFERTCEMMGISYAVNVYDIASSTKLFAIIDLAKSIIANKLVELASGYLWTWTWTFFFTIFGCSWWFYKHEFGFLLWFWFFYLWINLILFISDSSHPIIFKPSLVDKPGLPSWLQYIQRDPSDGMGYMYGTPSIESVGDFKIEVKVYQIIQFIGLNDRKPWAQYVAIA